MPQPSEAPAPVSLATRANLVAVTRASLVFVVVAMLYGGRERYLAAAGLTVVALWMDGLDGWVARRFGEVSRVGAAIDILTDRVVELTYWITFVALGWLPVWVALVVAVRGLLVDGVRLLAFERGLAAFGPSSMMRSSLGRALVASRASRAAYAIAKAAAWALLILASASHLAPAWRAPVLAAATASAYAAVALCVARGIPVLVEGRRLTTA